MPKIQTPLKSESPPLRERVSFRVSRLHARLNAQAARILARTAQISLSQWRVMVMIERAGEISASDIVRQTKFDKALVSRTIKSLVKQELVEVGVSQQDQRTHLIRFTKVGLQRFEQAWPHMLARQNTLIASLDDAEIAQFFATLSKIEAAIDGQGEV
ncbi:MAG: MarR family winged helix-turn-helix transcriptional regulator [Sedimentitalea sp.]